MDYLSILPLIGISFMSSGIVDGFGEWDDIARVFSNVAVRGECLGDDVFARPC